MISSKFHRDDVSLKKLYQISRILVILITCFLFLLPSEGIEAVGNTYYVSVDGSDANPGTKDQPFRTINKAITLVSAGDTVYIRTGVYKEAIRFSTSGNASAPINILAYPSEAPVIDGSFSIPGTGGFLFDIRGDYVNFSGVEIRNSAYGGIFVYGNYDVIDNVFVHHSIQPGIVITHGKYSVVQNSRIWKNSLVNEGGGHSWSSGISAGRDGVSSAIIRNNEVWENWGEGISTGHSDQITIEGNISHDNYSANIYITDATNINCQKNFVYMDPTSYVFGEGDNVGIMMGDETYSPPSSNIKILNNISFGNHRNFFWWQGVKGGGMNNVLIANNTFVNGTGNVSNGEGNVIIGQGTHSNVRFINNLVSQDDSLPVIATIAQAGITYSNNLWSKTPYAAASGSGDVIGDPLLAKNEDQFSPDWYRLTNGSPAIDKGKTLSEVTVDFFGNSRVNTPDIGAVEGEDTKPVLSFVSPNHKFAGGSSFTLSAYGSRYTPTSVIRWNGSDRPTTFVSSSKLIASISAADIASAGSVSVAVYNPETGGGLSRAVTVTINNSVPTITAISPDSKAAGSPGFYLVVNGKNFLPGALVRWNGANRSTTFLSSTKLIAVISSADISAVGTSTVTVVNPTSGDTISNSVVFSSK